MSLRPAAAERGFTLAELMAVIIIAGILGSVAMTSITARRDTALTAEKVRAKLIEARRRAMVLGPIRTERQNDANNPDDARTRLIFKEQQVVLQLFDDSGDATTWGTIDTLTIREGSHLAGVSDTASLTNTTNPTALDADGVTKQFFSDGQSDGMTVFIEESSGADNRPQYRIVVFPVSGLPVAIDNWGEL